MLTKLLNFVQKRLFFLIVVVIVGGLLNVKLLGGYTFTPFICLLAALVMIYPSLVPLPFEKFREIKHYRWLIFLSVILNFIMAPLLAYFLSGWLLPNEPILRLGFVILALLPGGGMVTTWALRSKADMLATVSIVLVNLILAIIIVPFGVALSAKQLGIDTQLSVPETNLDTQQEMCVVEQATQGTASCDFGGAGITPLKIIIPIIFIIFIPLLLALTTQKIIIKKKGTKYFKKIKSQFGAFSNLGLLIVLFILMSLESNRVIFEQGEVLGRVFLGLGIFYGLTFLVAWWWYRKFNRSAKGKALLWGSYLRYITLALGLVISLVYQDQTLSPIILVVVLSYLIQIPSSFVIAQRLEGNKLQEK